MHRSTEFNEGHHNWAHFGKPGLKEAMREVMEGSNIDAVNRAGIYNSFEMDEMLKTKPQKLAVVKRIFKIFQRQHSFITLDQIKAVMFNDGVRVYTEEQLERLKPNYHTFVQEEIEWHKRHITDCRRKCRQRKDEIARLLDQIALRDITKEKIENNVFQGISPETKQLYEEIVKRNDLTSQKTKQWNILIRIQRFFKTYANYNCNITMVGNRRIHCTIRDAFTAQLVPGNKFKVKPDDRDFAIR